MINKEKINKLKNFFLRDLWLLNLNDTPLRKRFGFVSLRVSFIIIKDFIRHKCKLHAAALTNITLMSLVPTLALMFSMAKGLGMYEKFEPEIQNKLAEMPPGVADVINKLLEMVNNTNFTTMGIVGSMLIFWVVISMISKIEETFNLIWGVKENRTLTRKFTDYISVLVVVPILILATSSLTAAIQSPELMSKLEYYASGLMWLYAIIIRLFSMMVLAGAFTFLFLALPNTKIKFLPAFFAGIVTTLLWQAAQWIYITFQVGVSKYDAIYGTFSSIPLFLAWLYISWIIIIFGAMVSFAIQNHKTYELEGKIEDTSFTSIQMLSFFISTEIATYFHKGQEWKASKFVDQYNIPVRLVNKILNILKDNNLIKCLDLQEGLYLPSKDIETITLGDIDRAIKGNQEDFIKTLPGETVDKLESIFKEINSPYLETLDKQTLKSLAK